MIRRIQNWDDADVYNLALVAWKEARHDGLAACVAVMLVCVNRVLSGRFAGTLHDVIYQKNQFTSMSVPQDPEYNIKPQPEDPIWADLIIDAHTLLAEGTDDYTNGALYYANLKTMDKRGWFDRNIAAQPELHPKVFQVGGHTFYA